MFLSMMMYTGRSGNPKKCSVHKDVSSQKEKEEMFGGNPQI
jgi:hypothetical protein